MDLILSMLEWRSMAHYREVLLTQKLLPVMCEICGKFFIFQQGNAPHACKAINLE